MLAGNPQVPSKSLHCRTWAGTGRGRRTAGLLLRTAGQANECNEKKKKKGVGVNHGQAQRIIPRRSKIRWMSTRPLHKCVPRVYDRRRTEAMAPICLLRQALDQETLHFKMPWIDLQGFSTQQLLKSCQAILPCAPEHIAQKPSLQAASGPA